MTDLILELVRARITAGKLRHVSNHKGGEWHSPCPVCGGDDRFHVWPNQDGGAVPQKAGVPGTWWCRSCDKTGDVIDLLRFADGLEFKAACKALNIELQESGRRLRPLRQPQAAPAWVPTEWRVPEEKWRMQATRLALSAHEQLLAFPRGLEYLAGRGLPLEAVCRYHLGFLQAEDRRTGTCLFRSRKAFGLPDKINADGSKTRTVLWIPRGFTIPLWAGDEVHRIRIRRPQGDLKSEDDSKFMLLTGSGQAPMLLPAEGVPPPMTAWVVVEAEMDAMAVHYACGGKVGVMAALTNKGKPDALAHKLLSVSPLILVALDFDVPGRVKQDPNDQGQQKKGKRPGYEGWKWWREQYAQARRWPVPVGKDPGEAFSKGFSLSAWIDAALPQALSPDAHVGRCGAAGLGIASSGKLWSGDGEEQPAAKQSPEPCCHGMPAAPQASSPHSRGPLRWSGATANTPLNEAVLPDGSPSMPELRRVFAGKGIDGETLVTCPKHRWWWTYYRYCVQCAGHRHCIADFLVSSQMRTPLCAVADEPVRDVSTAQTEQGAA